MIYIGIDNGVTGAICVIDGIKTHIYKMPVFKALEYTKTKQTVTRIDFKKLIEILSEFKVLTEGSICYIERPMVNPKRFKATKSAIRCLEATLICLEYIGIPYKFIDSKEWQKHFLPKGIGKDDLKFASLEIARQRFSLELKDSNLSDALLIAEYCKLKEGK